MEDPEALMKELRRASGGYFRSKFPNKVAPMSYMHYKTMLRERASTQISNGSGRYMNGDATNNNNGSAAGTR